MPEGRRAVLDTNIPSFLSPDYLETLGCWLASDAPKPVLLSAVARQLARAGLQETVASWEREGWVDAVKVRKGDPADREAARLQRRKDLRGRVRGDPTDILVVAWARGNDGHVITAERGILGLCGEIHVPCWDLLDLAMDFAERRLADDAVLASFFEPRWNRSGSAPGRPADWAGSFAETARRRRAARP